ncbi:hypothetical protein TNIN_63691 [Trichonephila inaurata madagascariensis]|uniref:Uncharacterized protein n=1 Tax=Trichonephila inaurata madagascariensis TaxID=2747483 RepID=A0A8X6Y9U6_9ARAC|nr:hypothetical protein TNIN_63691 [Trichonephila inaurata madagascariensis]
MRSERSPPVQLPPQPLGPILPSPNLPVDPIPTLSNFNTLSSQTSHLKVPRSPVPIPVGPIVHRSLPKSHGRLPSNSYRSLSVHFSSS